jgi:hypothetical protein
MNSNSGFTSKKMDGFLGKLSDLVGSLPSPDEKSRIDNDLKVLINYLEGIRKQLELVPTRSQIDSSVIERLRGLMKAVDSDPVLSGVLGLSTNGRRVSRRARALGDDARARAREVAKELETLSGDQVQHRLLDKSYSVALLRQIGGELGIRIPSKASRSSVIDTIAGKLSNRRGYEILRHGGNA